MRSPLLLRADGHGAAASYSLERSRLVITDARVLIIDSRLVTNSGYLFVG